MRQKMIWLIAVSAGSLASLTAAAQLGQLTWVAPHLHLSGCSHQVTTQEPVRVNQRGPGRFAANR